MYVIMNLIISSFPLQMEALPMLSPRQMAELMVVPLPRLPPKAEVVDRVFDHLMTLDPMEGTLLSVLDHLVQFSHDVMNTHYIYNLRFGFFFHIHELECIRCLYAPCIHILR